VYRFEIEDYDTFRDNIENDPYIEVDDDQLHIYIAGKQVYSYALK